MMDIAILISMVAHKHKDKHKLCLLKSNIILMASKQSIITKIQNNIMNSNSNISFSLSHKNKDKNLYTLLIYNPNQEYFELTDSNIIFFKKFNKMLFDTNKKTKKGCFNQQYSDDSSLYNETSESMTNKYLQSQYTCILINEKCHPLSIFCINNNYIWNVCTHYNSRNKGYMKHLLDHVLKLIVNHKLKINIPLLRLTIKHNNPKKKMLKEYYKSFGFIIENNNLEEITMKLVLN